MIYSNTNHSIISPNEVPNYDNYKKVEESYPFPLRHGYLELLLLLELNLLLVWVDSSSES